MRTILNIMTPPPPPPPGSAQCAPPELCAADLVRGERAVVVDVRAPACEVERLAALGLVPGAVLGVLRGGSTLRLALGETRLALGRAWARALRVVRC